MLRIFKTRHVSPQELADQAERILSGQSREWDVDDYEHRNLKDLKLKHLHLRTLSFGMPEEWWKLDDVGKDALRRIIQEMRQTSRG
jgi:hypothetical protein